MSQLTTTPKPTALRTILLAGFIAGSLDILTAFVHYYILSGRNPIKILNYIASGVFGKEIAYAPGVIMPIVGLILHFIIAFSFTIFFFWLYPKWKALAWNKFVTAFGYGLFVWAVMNFIIVPMSQTTKGGGFDISKASIAAAILICMISSPITFIIGNYYSKRKIK